MEDNPGKLEKHPGGNVPAVAGSGQASGHEDAGQSLFTLANVPNFYLA